MMKLGEIKLTPVFIKCFNSSIVTVKTLLQSGKSVVWCGTAVDSRDSVVKWRDIKNARNTINNVQYYDISSRSGYSIDKPLVEFISRSINSIINN